MVLVFADNETDQNTGVKSRRRFAGTGSNMVKKVFNNYFYYQYRKMELKFNYFALDNRRWSTLYILSEWK